MKALLYDMHSFSIVGKGRRQQKTVKSSCSELPMPLFIPQTYTENLLDKQPQSRHYGTQGKQRSIKYGTYLPAI